MDDAKSLIQRCQHRFATTKTRLPLLSSASRPSTPGIPGSARLAGDNAQPPFGTDKFSYSYILRIHFSFPRPGSYNRGTH
jgi:hypothetical protein